MLYAAEAKISTLDTAHGQQPLAVLAAPRLYTNACWVVPLFSAPWDKLSQSRLPAPLLLLILAFIRHARQFFIQVQPKLLRYLRQYKLPAFQFLSGNMLPISLYKRRQPLHFDKSSSRMDT